MKKKAAKTSKSSARKTTIKNTSLIERYYQQTDAFFTTHPNARILIGVYIVTFAIFIGVMFRNKAMVMGWSASM